MEKSIPKYYRPFQVHRIVVLLKQCLSLTMNVLDKQSALLLKDLNKRHLYSKIDYTSYLDLLTILKQMKGHIITHLK